ncbi:hypothetical protein LDENG_00010950, partial [Lucifuga dentata]
MLFIGYSSAFNTIIPSKRVSKLVDLGLETSICSWIFLTGRPQVVRIGSHTSSSLIYADDTTILGLITDNNETAYREEVKALNSWCQDNNLSLNVSKTKEMIVDYR